MLLLAYTPRQPSIGTENMLRCAYRAGLRGEALLNDNGDGWKMGGGPDRTLQDAPRTDSSCSGVSGYQDNTEKARDPTHDMEARHALSHAGAPTKVLPRNVVATRKGCRPILLSFRLSPGVMERCATTSTGNNSDDFIGCKAFPPSSVRAAESLSESAWLSEWESVFPDLRYRQSAVRDTASGLNKVLARRRGVRNTDDDEVTDEYLWGYPSVEL